MRVLVLERVLRALALALVLILLVGTGVCASIPKKERCLEREGVAREGQSASDLIQDGKAWERDASKASSSSSSQSLRNAEECYKLSLTFASSAKSNDDDSAQFSVAQVSLARVLAKQSKHGECLEVLGKSPSAKVAQNEPSIGSWEKSFWRGYCNLLLMQLKEAENHLEQARHILSASSSPAASVAVHYHYGLVLTHLGRYEEAMLMFQHVLSLDALHVNALVNLGGVQFASNLYEEAIQSFERASLLTPGDIAIWENLASASAKAEKWSQAVRAYDKALDLDKTRLGLVLKRQHCKQQACDWSSWKEDMQLVQDLMDVGSGDMISPFNSLSLGLTAASQKLVAIAKARQIHKQANKIREKKEEGKRKPKKEKKKEKRIGIGYISPDFREHPVGFLFEHFFHFHDRTKFDVYAYAINPENGSKQREKVSKSVEHFVSIHELSTEQVLQRLVDDEIDIVVNLGGYTAGNRNEIFAHEELDAVKVLFCGYAGTLGLPNFGYILTDAISSPVSHAKHYSENLGHISPSFHPMHHKLHYGGHLEHQIGSDLPQRSTYELPDGGFVFCSFNSHYKIEPTVFRQWLNILGRVEGSVLWLAWASLEIQTNLKRKARSGGISSDRIIFLRWLPEEEHLTAKSLCNVFLDTLSYNAHMTAADAIFAGIPLLTMPGGAMASRIGASIATAGGLGHLVVSSLQQYEDTAVDLAKNESFYKESRRVASEAKDNAPLFDLHAKVLEVETLFLMMHDLKMAGYKRPFHLFLTKTRQKASPKHEDRSHDHQGHPKEQQYHSEL